MKSENIEQNNIKKNQFKGRELFYGIIAISLFIVMAVGATFAYFTATTRSTNTAVTTQSTSLQLDYISYSGAWMKNDLIPADTRVVEYSVEHQNDTTAKKETTEGADGEDPTITYLKNNTICVDDYGNSICSIYEFQIGNKANSPLVVNIDLVSTLNEFGNLHAMAYKLSLPEVGSEDEKAYNSTENNNGANDPVFKTTSDDATPNTIEVLNAQGQAVYLPNYNPIYVNRNGTVKTLLSYTETGENDEGEPIISTKPSIELEVKKATMDAYPETKDRTSRLADNITINGGETLTFAIILYIKNDQYNDQTSVDAKKTFTGQVVVSSGDGDTGVSGTIEAMGTQELQSGITE